MDKIFSKLYSILPLKIQFLWKRVEDSDLGSRIANGAFWSIAGSVASQGLMLLASIFVARILGKTEFGELGMIRSTVNMFTVFASFGLGLTATKHIAELRIKDKAKTGKIIGLTTLFAGGTGTIIATTILIAAPYLAKHTINAPHLVTEIRLGAIMLLFSALNGAQTGTLIGFEAFKAIAKVSLFSGVLAFPIQIGFTLFFGLPGSVTGFGLYFLIMWILNFRAVRKEALRFGVSIQFRNVWSEWYILYKFSLPALLGGIMVSLIIWVSNTILVNQPNGYNEMALFSAANQWSSAVLFIPAILSQVALPLLCSSLNNQIQFMRILKLNVLINFIISLIMAIGISLFSGIIMTTYGKDFEEGKLVLIILSFTTIMISVNGVIGQAIAGRGQMWYGFLLNFLWSIILLACSYILLNFGYGAKGLAYAMLISYIFHTFFQSIFVKLQYNKFD